MKELFKYIEDGLTITKIDGGYNVFTTITQHFKISSLDELTTERFEKAIKNLKERTDFEKMMIDLSELPSKGEFYSEKDFNIIVDAIKNPPKPNEALKNAMKNYNKIISNDRKNNTGRD